jgi:uncharacterized protein
VSKRGVQSARLAVPRMVQSLVLLWMVAVSAAWADEPEFDFHPPPTATDPATPALMRDLAERLLPVYQDPDADRYLANLSALQMAAGDYAAADVSRQSLRERRRNADAARPAGRSMMHDLYTHARALEAENHIPFAEAFTKAYRDVIPRLNDQDAYAVTRWLGLSPSVAQEDLRKLLDQQRAKDSIGQSEAVDLIRTYVAFDAYRSFGALVESLNAEDDRQRYTAGEQVHIKTREGTSIDALVVRPRSPSARLPALLEFTIGDSRNYAMECAAHGYIGVVAYARGRHQSSGTVIPYQHDGDDARAVINWIAKQPWSDGRVGMYGNGYSGFAAWSAATRLPVALKAIATSDPSAPGVDVPMEGSIFHNSAYRWSLHVTNPQSSADESPEDDAMWHSLDQKWYESGSRYRDLGRLYGKPDPIFIRWLNHPSYDRYWQLMIPYREQFAHINIPVLTITGYFATSEPGALYYFAEHYRYNPRADHTLVIGPYDDSTVQGGAVAELHGFQVDPAALINLHELLYQWFDHVLKRGATPLLLKSRVNYEVMGANEWRHAATLEAMATGSLRLYLDESAFGDGHRMTQRKASRAAFIRQTINFSDRSDAGWTPPTDFISKHLIPHNGIMFVSERLAKPTEIDGLFSGRLDFTVNKLDMDPNIMLYELSADGDYVRLFTPSFEFRASYVRDRVHRQLLEAGSRQQLTFRSERMTSRQLQAGSRLVMVLGINKRPDREINYGTGKDVSEESIEDGKIPLKIRWYNDSYIEVPVRRPQVAPGGAR